MGETLAISRGRVGYTIHEILDTKKLSVKWGPKYLNANPKRDQVLASQAMGVCVCEWVGARACLCDPETKEQSKAWRHSGSPESKEIQDTEVIKQGVGVFSETDMDFCL
jgi:hypothetical protein